MANSAFNPVAKATGGNLFHSDETVTGSVNGSNTVFTTQAPYVASTLEVYINGLRQARTTHVTETSPSVGTFTLDTAPLTGDIIRVNYQQTVAQTNAADTVDSFHANSTPTADTILPLNSSGKFPVTVVNNPYKFYATRNTSWTTSTSMAKVNLNNIVFDTNSNFDNTTNYRYNVPITGYYWVSYGATSQVTIGTGYYAELSKNGNPVARGTAAISAYNNTGLWASSQGTALLYLSAGDFLELAYVGGSSNAGGTGYQTFMSGMLVSET